MDHMHEDMQCDRTYNGNMQCKDIREAAIPKESFQSHKAEINQILEEVKMKGRNLGDEREIITGCTLAMTPNSS
jgi:hypothetical protein